MLKELQVYVQVSKMAAWFQAVSLTNGHKLHRGGELYILRELCPRKMLVNIACTRVNNTFLHVLCVGLCIVFLLLNTRNEQELLIQTA